jgi:NAD(P)H dehydrogenase (quinone)
MDKPIGSVDSVRVVVAYFSGFKGATAALAQAVARGAASVPGVQVTVVNVEDIAEHWDSLHRADAMIFGSPTYVGSVAAGFKQFIERCAGDVWLGRLWLNKVAGAFTVSAGRSGDKLNCLQDIAIFAAQMGMVWVPVRITGGNYSTAGSEADLNRMAGYLGVMAQANIDEPPELAPPPSDIATAEMHGAHITWVARQLRAGRVAAPAPYDSFVDAVPSGRPRVLSEMG